MSDLVGNHIVGFPTRRFKYILFQSVPAFVFVISFSVDLHFLGETLIPIVQAPEDPP